MDISRIIAYIEENLRDPELVNIPVLASRAGYSEYHFIRLFRKKFGATPLQFKRHET